MARGHGPVIAVTGIQGSGRALQAKQLAKALGWSHVAVPTLLRSAVTENAAIGREVGRAFACGERVRPELVSSVIAEGLRAQSGGVVLAGFPRELRELRLAQEAGLHLNVVVQVVVSVQEAMTRLAARRECDRCGRTMVVGRLQQPCACGGALVPRTGDNADAILRRLELFEDETRPVLAWLEKCGQLVRVHGRGDPDTVTRRMLTALAAHTRERTHAAPPQPVGALAS